MIRITLFAALLLSGCSYTSSELQQAEAMCKAHGGVESLPASIRIEGAITVNCNDGLTISKGDGETYPPPPAALQQGKGDD